uniref:DUF753 domain-containing protein n=2 Tax=Lutzomyia longipalpis TaxID=7200 RepID=A0A1B0CQC0_LUTLO
MTSCAGLCSVCMGVNCNDRIYPADRLECHQCVNCPAALETNLQPCVNYQAIDQCFVAVEEQNGILTTYRGCASDPQDNIAQQGCTNNDQYCMKCEGSGCNIDPQSTPSILTCVQCNPDDEICNDPQEIDATVCTHQVPLGRTDECYTYRLGDGRAQRGCLLNPSTPQEYLEQCYGEDRTCDTCSTPSCNAGHPLEVDIFYCVVCDESVDPDCRLLNSQHEPQQCPEGPLYARGCYRYESNNIVRRGCVSSLVGTQQLEDCHAVDFQRCYNCNSGLEVDCLRVQNNTRPVRVCQDYMDTCINIIQDLTRNTIRGCAFEVDNLHNALETHRQTCATNFCNSGIYPSWRTTCHQCDTGEECNRDSTETSEFLLPCKIFWQDDSCYSVLRERQALRGCLSDGDLNAAYCQSAATCEACLGVGCNSRPAVRPPQMSCITCWDHEMCNWGFPEPVGYECQEDVWMGQQEGCYTGIDPEGNVTRGCILSSIQGCPEDSSCNYCYSNNCNSLAVTRQQCIHCRSSSPGQESCAESAEDLISRECSGDYQPYPTRGCYTMRIQNDVVIRGCLRDLHPDDYVACQVEENNFCDLCLEQGCNTDVAPQGGQRLCYNCDSATDATCATLSSTLPQKTCASATDTCFTAIIDTRTVRGCLAEDYTGPCEGPLCESCGANYCNAAIFPSNRAQCHRCEGAQCAEITNNDNLEVCTSYNENDSCYTVVVDDTLVTYRGCFSDPATTTGRQECTRLDAQGFCISCAGAACNNQPAIAASQMECMKCNGDASCRYGQPQDFGLQCLHDTLLGRPEYCYSYVTGGNSVTRGCLYDPFTDENYLEQCETGAVNCTLCTFNLCNYESYAYHTCFSCDGHTDPNCGTLDGWYEPQECPSGTIDQVGCFTATTDGVPMRGCKSQLNTDEIAFCSSSQSSCSLCDGDNCNGRPNGYTQRACSGSISCQSGNPCMQCDGPNCNDQVLPTDRLKCHKCSGAGCADISDEANLEYCELYDANDQCFTVVTDAEVAHRGCYSDPSSAAAKSVCTQHESGNDRCVKCSGEGCNTQATKSPATLSCIKCTGPSCSDSQASTPGQACFGDVLLGRTESCYSYIHDNGQVERGCLYDPSTSQAISNECSNSPGGRCKVCTGGNCNTEQLEVTETCYSCDSSLDPGCATMTGTIATKQCPIGTVLGCFRSEVDGIVVRGCAGELQGGEIGLCQRGTTCKLCDGNNCNEKVDFQRCYTCNSANSGAACTDLQDVANQAVCTDYMDSCIVAIGQNGETIRGCASTYLPDFPTCNSYTCQICAGGYCNGAVFPAARKQCHQCSGTDACIQSLTSASDTLKVCTTYEAADQCYTVVTDGEVHRGCTSDTSQGNTKLQRSRSAPTLSCIKCAANDVACLWGFSDSAVERCVNDVWIGTQETCYRMISGSSAVRGCTLDNPTQCPDSNTACIKCTGNGCNSVTFKYQQCLLCSSDTEGQETCGSEPTEYSSTQCSGDSQTYEGRGCYVLVDDDGVVKRGCAKDLGDQLLTQCKSEDNEECTYCENDGCNDWPAGASAIQAFSVGAMLLVAIAGKFFS